MSSRTAAALVLILFVAHQDVWFWREAHPLVLGFMPIGLFYHAAFTVACAIVLGLLVKLAWPAHLETVSPEPRPKAGLPSR